MHAGTIIMREKEIVRAVNRLRFHYRSATFSDITTQLDFLRGTGLTLDPPRGVSALELNQGDTKSGRIARADVAAICAESIFR